MNTLLPWQEQPYNQLVQLKNNNTLPNVLLLQGKEPANLLCIAKQFINKQICQKSTGKLACGLCNNCYWFENNHHPDVCMILPENSTIKIEAIRRLTEFANLQSANKQYVLLSQAEKLTLPAVNAILKTLEESSTNITFLLTTCNTHRLPATLRSRTYALTCPTPSFHAAKDYLNAKMPHLNNIEFYLWMSQNDINLACQWSSANIDLLDTFVSLLTQKQCPIAVATKWQVFEPDAIFAFLEAMITTLTTEQYPTSMRTTLLPLIGMLSKPRLFLLWSFFLKQKKIYQQSPIINTQLLLENLLIQLKRLAISS